MSLSLISYFVCLKASNQSDLMQHNVPAAIFHMTQYSVCGIWSGRRVFRACSFLLTLRHTERVVTKHNNMRYARQHRVRSACLLRLVCCFGVLTCICGARCGAVNFTCAAVNFTRSLFAAVFFTCTAVFCACATTDGSSKFCSFLLCEIICQYGHFKYKI